MIRNRASNYCAEPTPYQAEAMVQWVATCRYLYNLGVEQRRIWGEGVTSITIPRLRN